MKKISAIAAFMLALPIVMSAQAQITTKKMKLEDFGAKTTQIMLSGNTFLDTSL